MPFYRRGYYRRGRSGYGYRGYNRSWRRRGWYRRGGLSRASTQGNRRFSVVVPTQAVFSFTVPGGSYWSDLHGVCPYCSDPSLKTTHAALTSSLLYRTYTRLYDQVKVDWVSVKISIMSLVGNGGVAPAVKVCTSWDRDMRYTDLTSLGSASTPSVPTTETIQTGSESQTSLIVNNSRAVINRFNGASDIQERTVFHDCSLDLVSSSYYVDASYYTSTGSSSVGYCPGLYMALNTATAPGSDTSFVFTCSLDVKWHVTFRNPKFGLTSASRSDSKSVGDLAVEAVKSEGAGKSVAKKVTFDAGAVSDVLPTFNGLLGDVVDRLSANSHEEGVYDDGEYNRDEDIEFAYRKLGDEKFHEVFKDVYDVSLKELGLISDSKSTVSKGA